MRICLHSLLFVPHPRAKDLGGLELRLYVEKLGWLQVDKNCFCTLSFSKLIYYLYNKMRIICNTGYTSLNDIEYSNN
jgi:hypothetical protein